jgi:hypothetical protein
MPAEKPSAAEVLTGSAADHPKMRITMSQKLYYDHRLDKPSFDAECTSGSGARRPRDFQSLRERERERESG